MNFSENDPDCAILDRFPDLVARLDRSLRIVYVNRAVEVWFGCVAERLKGLPLDAAGLPLPLAGSIARAADAVFAGNPLCRFGYTHERSEGCRHYQARLLPEFDSAGVIASALLIVAEEQSAAHAREQQVAGDAARVAEARDGFLSRMAHELRSPLNAIQTWTHVLGQVLRSGDPLVGRALDGIRNAVDEQARQIAGLLDLTRMMRDKLQIAREPVVVRPLIEEGLQRLRPEAEAKEVALEGELALNGQQILGDARRLRQIVRELVAHAIRFTPRGGHVRVCARAEAGSMALAVIDDGYGLPSALLPLLFDPLRAEGRIAHDHGPGLALVRHLVELHGGRLDAESAGEGQGTTMRVCLPLMQGGARAGVAQAHPLTGGQSLEGLRVLVVDDEREVRESFALLLQQEGAEVRMAGSGREAVCLVTDASEKDRPQVLLCDIAMPDQDGCATLRRIRAWEDARADGTHVPAVAVTANTRQEDRLRAAAAGFELYLTKPVTPADLALAVARAAQAVRH